MNDAQTSGWITLVAGLVWWLAAPVLAEQPGDLGQLRQAALDRTNAARAAEGLAALRPSDVLDDAAQRHAADMLARGYFDHVTPEGETPFDRFRKAGGNRWAVSGENIASCSGCATPPTAARIKAFHEGWMQSEGHRENILSRGFDSFGFGISGAEGEVYAVQTFSGPGAASSADGEAQMVAPQAARDAALDEVNAVRAAAGLAPLDADGALDELAGRVLPAVADDAEALPDDIFGLLPEGSSGWTSLSLQSASRGGSGPEMTRQDVVVFVTDWISAGKPGETIGGPAASHMGFAAEAGGDGRKSAVAVFGGRE